MASTTPFATRQLYGGAITAELPTGAVDASDLRQIPDAQEVFVMPDSEVSLVLEVLEAVEEAGLKAALEIHWSANVHDNEALSATEERAETLETFHIGNIAVQRGLISGKQRMAKFDERAEEARDVVVRLALWRLPDKRADLVLAVYEPPGSNGVEIFQKAAASLEIRDLALFVAVHEGEG